MPNVFITDGFRMNKNTEWYFEISSDLYRKISLDQSNNNYIFSSLYYDGRGIIIESNVFTISSSDDIFFEIDKMGLIVKTSGGRSFQI